MLKVISFFLFISITSSFVVKNKNQIFTLINDENDVYKISSNVKGELVVGSVVTYEAVLSKKINQNIAVELICKGEKCKDILGKIVFEKKTFTSDKLSLKWDLSLKSNGYVELMVIPENTEKTIIDNTHSLIILKVGKSNTLALWSNIVGYIYFFAWMFSLYPQLIKNYKNKSVVGLNLDFVFLNTTGYLAYSVYNVCLFFIPQFQNVYSIKFPGSQIPVQLNDVLFALHGVLINILTCLQCIFYERGNQNLTQTAKALLISVYSPAIILLLFYLFDGIDKFYFISYFSYVKLTLTFCKYTPQAYFNYRRKSTEGWSIYYCLLDFTGGSFSLLQMFLNSFNQGDWRNFTGNIGKVGLGLVSILFDLLFIVQHYILYNKKNKTFFQNQVSYENSAINKSKLSIRKDRVNNLDNIDNSCKIDDTSKGVNNEAFEDNN